MSDNINSVDLTYYQKERNPIIQIPFINFLLVNKIKLNTYFSHSENPRLRKSRNRRTSLQCLG